MTTSPQFVLNDGNSIPQLGFGVWQVEDDAAYEAVTHALKAGYRHIDTAAAYKNEHGVGRAIADSGIPRDQIFVTTKLWNEDQGYDEALAAYDASLERLGLEYVDLYLTHWPVPRYDLYADSWKALVKLKEEGRVRSIGVSNHHETHLKRIIAETGVEPVLNQIELHPYLQQIQLRKLHRELGIATEAWSPLGQGGDELSDEMIVAIAEKRQATPAQVILAWHLAVGNIVIPKSVTPSRIQENFASLNVELDEFDIDAIAKLDRGVRLGADPDEADFGKPKKLG